MIPVRKLRRLRAPTARRRAAEQLRALEAELPLDTIEQAYLHELLQYLQREHSLDRSTREALQTCHRAATEHLSTELGRELNSLYWALLSEIGEAPADWDLQPPSASSPSPFPSEPPPSAVGTSVTSPEMWSSSQTPQSPLQGVELYLDGIRSPFNLGSILRTGAAMGVLRLLLSPDTVSPDHPRARRSAMGAELPIARLSYDELRAGGRRLTAVETGGQPLPEYTPPARSLVLILGSEETGIHPQLLQSVDDRVTIPLYGTKTSLNVGVAAGIVLQTISERLIGVSPEGTG